MTFIVQITLRPRKDDYGRGIIVFYKEIGAANEKQAQDFARQMLVGFLTDGVTVETEVVYEQGEYVKKEDVITYLKVFDWNMPREELIEKFKEMPAINFTE